VIGALSASNLSSSGAQWCTATTTGGTVTFWPTDGVGGSTVTSSSSLLLNAKKVLVYGFYISANTAAAVTVGPSDSAGAAYSSNAGAGLRLTLTGVTGWVPYGPEGVLLTPYGGATSINAGLRFTNALVGTISVSMIFKWLE
jgi:hypothetical protein